VAASGREQRRPIPVRALVGVVAVLTLVAGVAYVATRDGGKGGTKTAAGGGTTAPSGSTGGTDANAGSGAATTTTAPSGLAPKSTYTGWSDPARSGQPWSSTVLGQLTFRGNPTRSYYGLGPVPKNPKVLWSLPKSGGWCGNSRVGGENKQWCGSGWTGQPSVWKKGDQTWVAIGAYDKNIHFLNYDNGENFLEPFGMGDIIKGSVTVDPDGFPLLYSGSRANFHILAFDRDGAPADLWSMSANNVSPTKWNDDWDSSPLVIDDYLFEGGENGQWYIFKLNRGYGADGKVTIDPKMVFHAPGWDDQLLKDLAGSGSRVNDVSIENSLTIVGNTVYFTNSGGLVQGWDISGLKDGKDPERVFRFWTGDDTDASIVADADGMLYVGQENERSSSKARNEEIGQLLKLDPSKPDNPLVWKINDSKGIWATPGISDGVVVAPTDSGRIIGADQKTGEILWEKKLPGPTWSSPVIVDKVWIQGDCAGNLRAFDFSNPRTEPKELWSVSLEGCVESTPTVFQGRIFVGARGGKFYAIGDA
jgi:hypothetical protein